MRAPCSNWYIYICEDIVHVPCTCWYIYICEDAVFACTMYLLVHMHICRYCTCVHHVLIGTYTYANMLYLNHVPVCYIYIREDVVQACTMYLLVHIHKCRCCTSVYHGPVGTYTFVKMLYLHVPCTMYHVPCTMYCTC